MFLKSTWGNCNILVDSAYWLISIQVHFKLISGAFQRGAVDLL